MHSGAYLEKYHTNFELCLARVSHSDDVKYERFVSITQLRMCLARASHRDGEKSVSIQIRVITLIIIEWRHIASD